MKELKISAIENGTVIDHIPSNHTFKVVDLLDLEGIEDTVSVATNLESKAMKKKGIVKVGGKELTKEEVDKIALLAPDATVNFIQDYEVVRKERVDIHDKVKGIIKCGNPNCITNNEEVTTKFYVLEENPLKVKCHYCERIFDQSDVEIK